MIMSSFTNETGPGPVAERSATPTTEAGHPERAPWYLYLGGALVIGLLIAELATFFWTGH
jgi:hypothetical protein